MSFEQLADREYARNVGREDPTACWVLSDRDVWYRNPFYSGPMQPHPEDDADMYEEADEADEAGGGTFATITEADLDDMPF